MRTLRTPSIAAVFASVAAAAGLASVAGAASAPKIRSVHMSVKIFAVGDWNTPLDTTGGTEAKRAKVHRGTQLRVTLNKAATLVVVAQKLKRGRRVNGECVKVRHGNRHQPSCKRRVNKMKLVRDAHAGKNPIHFSGRSDGKVLRPGPYQFVIHAEKDGLRSEKRTVRFRIVRG